MTTSPDAPGPADDRDVEQQTGVASGAPGEGAGDEGTERELGVRAAVERGPAETSSEGEPVPDNPHAALEDREQARSTDEL